MQDRQDQAAALRVFSEKGFVPRHVNLAGGSGQALQFKKKNNKTKQKTRTRKPNKKPNQNTKALAGTILDAEMEIWPESLALIKVEERG